MQEQSLSNVMQAIELGYHKVPNKKVFGITCDSRRIKPGWIFVAIEGEKMNGLDFVEDAIEHGAIAVVCGLGKSKVLSKHKNDVYIIEVACPRQIYSQMVTTFYVDQPKHIVSVTGTNGKTSVVFFCQQLWSLLGVSSASIGTMGVYTRLVHDTSFPEFGEQPHLTTPDTEQLHNTLSRLFNEGIEYIAMEASSHGLHQYRLDGVKVKAAGFTNFSHDHLDYHGSMEAYFSAKLRLFTRVLCEDGIAVLPVDDPQFPLLIQACKENKKQILTYGRTGGDLHLLSVHTTRMGQEIIIVIEGKEYGVSLPLFGAFQLQNILCAMGLVFCSGFGWDDITRVLPCMSPVPGRLEHIHEGNDNIAVFIDYAHTPDALSTLLHVLSEDLDDGALWVVFGCGGDRDTTKRSEMGKVAAEMADYIIVTDDNPRTEDPALIRKQIMQSSSQAKEIADRSDAIEYAVMNAKANDVVVIAGKGHERYQIIGAKTIPFSDKDEALKSLEKRRGIRI